MLIQVQTYTHESFKWKQYSLPRIGTEINSVYFSLFPPPPMPLTAPSPITVIRKDRTSRNSVSLSWQEPEHPNGIILDYEVKYYEKVGRKIEGDVCNEIIASCLC